MQSIYNPKDVDRINTLMDKQRLLELAGIEGKPLTEDLSGDRQSGISWDDALAAVAANIVDGTEGVLDTDADVREIADELMGGRWTDQLRDKLVDELVDRDRRSR